MFQKKTPYSVILTTCHPRAEGDRNYNVSYFIWEEGSSDVLKRGGGRIPLIAAPADFSTPTRHPGFIPGSPISLVLKYYAGSSITPSAWLGTLVPFTFLS